jgi:hypothetical protein
MEWSKHGSGGPTIYCCQHATTSTWTKTLTNISIDWWGYAWVVIDKTNSLGIFPS